MTDPDLSYGIGHMATVKGLGAAKWAETALIRHWNAVSDVVGPKAMPTGTLERRLGKKLDQLGCGHYGCVLATAEPGVVLKLTRDVDEAFFAAHAMAMGSWPTGITAYYQIFSLPWATRYDQQIYAMWREEAFDIGFLDLESSRDGLSQHVRRAYKEAINILGAYKESAQLVYRAYKQRRNDPEAWFELLTRAHAREGWARGRVNVLDALHTTTAVWDIQTAYRGAERLAVALNLCAQLAQWAAQTELIYTVGEALDRYQSEGLLLCDVHVYNVGRIHRDGWAPPAIMDPGQAVPLRPELITAEIPEISV